MDPQAEVEHILTIDCPERTGIVHAVTGFLLEQGRDIVELKHFGDRRAGQFFMRVEVAGADAPDLTEHMREVFAPLAAEYGATWSLAPKGTKMRVLIMVSKFDHCLNDLLHRARLGELPIDVVAVVSNHTDHQSLAEWHNIPFFHVPVTPESKPAAEARLLELIEEFDVELVVLARYMQVLSDELSRKLTGKTINIHHSFLPSFKGAKPYHQAWDRGVKTVGATAHYVNAELDEGPIISQQVQDVDHTYSPADLVAAGRDTECKALSNAVKWHAEGRAFLYGNRTVVLR
ncbi:formyltetrahydrofolate deformylase [Paeniglutamicibacter gangotriensis]|uniref:Formyltetrahydrofolate deformylase n=1 Tax=Paeniglutamicibacter gangotriensis Lz1y TaxID=1276920 RepID=M7MS40_9MICC|nr:formyltetrahydrofolate deformylase [Paeniglutamicibacter gangotriensis]EMQ97836.1 formyltetrahydrofolate deformylase [Paeniglutamicibacter gangotriensis Lz1y]